MNLPTDKEMLDWLSGLNCASFEKHYHPFMDEWDEIEKNTGGYNGHIDLFTVESQHINNAPTLRHAIAEAMCKAQKAIQQKRTSDK